MAEGKGMLKNVLFLAIGLAVGVPGGFVMNDIVEQENPEDLAARCQDLQTQDQLDDLFQGLQQQRGQNPGAAPQ
jgi:hypothetical protein